MDKNFDFAKDIITTTVGGLLVIIISSVLKENQQVIIINSCLIMGIIVMNIYFNINRCKKCSKKIKIAKSTLEGAGGTKAILSECERTFDFMGVAGTKWIRKASNFDKVMKTIAAKHGRVRFILLNPYSEDAKKLSIVRGQKDNYMRYVIIENIRALIPYKEQGLDIRLKVYSHRPVFRIAIVDDGNKVYIGSYDPDNDGSDIPQIILDQDSDNEQIEELLRKQFLDYFSVEWEDNSLFEIDLNRMNDEEYIESIFESTH